MTREKNGQAKKLTLADLKSAGNWKDASESGRGRPPVEEKKPEPERPEGEDDFEVFQSAMMGVKPINTKFRGREVLAETELAARTRSEEKDPDGDVVTTLQDLVDGKIEFELEATNEYLQGRVKGLDNNIFKRLKTGHFSIEAHLDLHGLNSLQAQMNLYNFIRAEYLAGSRCVLIVTGRGRNSIDGLPILKSEIQHWLTREPLKRVVLGFCTSLPRDGGAGSVYVLLRRHKQYGGKVIWERFPFNPL